ncbi:MAG: hypothetical protein PQJ61_14255 [Spirochaetales bacterium]|uniref:Tyr recombinase domain-containing protein n=1 Tax=Candidatus Thalassospirochaeta sargassi TaxID=3119039 RepID=A0AAJ1IIN7_9SPIO|nr:hypothetical protein [Spirochaetales bacterium]
MGEIRALQRKAVFDDYIEVSVSWEKGHGLKCTKTGRSRYIPIPKVQTITGHSTDRMTENYFHADEYKDVLEITREI